MIGIFLLFTVQPSICAEKVTVEINQDDLSIRVNNPNWVSVCLVIHIINILVPGKRNG